MISAWPEFACPVFLERQLNFENWNNNPIGFVKEHAEA
jgi:hypothetical protein